MYWSNETLWPKMENKLFWNSPTYTLQLCILQHLKKRHFQFLHAKRWRHFQGKKGKHIKGQTDRIIDFFEKSKILSRTPKLNTRDLSPNRIIRPGSNKRSNKADITTNTNKKLRFHYHKHHKKIVNNIDEKAAKRTGGSWENAKILNKIPQTNYTFYKLPRKPNPVRRQH